MKTILIATVIGMLCFQSCTKENLITPKPSSSIVEDESLQMSQRIAHPIHSTDIPKEEIIIIKCGTEIPPKYPPKHPNGNKTSSSSESYKGGQTPPIYIHEKIELK